MESKDKERLQEFYEDKKLQIGSAYNKAYPKASKFMENADEKLKKIIDKLNDDEWETLRDRFADFYVYCL